MSGRFVFVGERQSPKAARTGATWQNGRLAARTLHDVLRAIGVEPEAQAFLNLWSAPGLGPAKQPPRRQSIAAVRRAVREGLCVVALGNLVARELERAKVPHVRMVHPAARGLIRKRERYVEHARAVLLNPNVDRLRAHKRAFA